MTLQKAHSGNVDLNYETLGSAHSEPLLLVMGIGGQLVSWHPDFCAALVDRGFQVVRFDNRDAGMSTHFAQAGSPNQLKVLLHPAAAAVYRLEDMADDAIAVLNAQGCRQANVVRSLAGRHDRADHRDPTP